MTEREKELEAENERLRAQLAAYETRARDAENPNVLLLEGRLSEEKGEYFALSVHGSSGMAYLAEALEDFHSSMCSKFSKSEQVTLQWHVSSEQKSYLELEMSKAEAALGQLNTRFSHAYSDLTGYLWTNEAIKLAGHDVLAEIKDAFYSMKGDAWLVLRAEIYE